VFHQWFSQLFFVLSLLHTFPFVMAGREVRPNKDGLNPMGLTQIGYSWHIGKVVSRSLSCPRNSDSPLEGCLGGAEYTPLLLSLIC
jgi:hypothetical protein